VVDHLWIGLSGKQFGILRM